MKISMKINLKVAAYIIVGIVIVFASFKAFAQTPAPQPDVPLEREGSTYQFSCQPVEPIDKMNQLCAVRTDQDEPVELGCVDHTTLDVATISITVERTPHQDAMIRCYATDTEGNVSDISENAGVADFTPPGRPNVK
jgi:hypothetical protein